MAAKNIKNRNLAASIDTTIKDAARMHHHNARQLADALQHKDVTTDYVKGQIKHDEFVTKINAQLGRAQRNVEAQQNSYQELLADTLTIKGASPTEALLAETRATKQWNRLERELTGVDKASALNKIANVISDAAKKGDQATLAGIVAEAPSFLRGKGFKDAEAVIESVIRAEEPSLAQAHAAIGEAEQVVAVTRYNAGAITNGLTRSIEGGITEYKIDDVPEYAAMLDSRTVIRGDYDPTADLANTLSNALSESDTDTASASDEGQVDDGRIYATQPGEPSRFNNAELGNPPGF